jgi:sulfite reductase (NADPH) hemoprotein beta-component
MSNGSHDTMTPDSLRAAANEGIKIASRRLRGTLVEGLADPLTGAITEADTQIIKFHGSYQQDDRDLREERRQQKLEPSYSFMIRTRLPGGVVTPQQWLQLDAIAGAYANGTLRLTTRQAFQFHGVIKTRLKATMRAINAALIDTVAACGDVNRNVVVAANPHASRVHDAVHAIASRVSEHLLPKTRAYYEIWLDDKRVAGSGEEDEPVYGATYLPRKFKIAFAVPPDNDADVFANDVGFIAVVEDGELAGFNVAAGGGLGTTHGDTKTYARLGDLLGFVAADRVVAVAEAIVTTQRDYGDRSDRKHARLKYTIDDRGLTWFKAEVERRAGLAFAPARPFRFDGNGDRFGWSQGEDGRWHVTLRIESGRIADRPGAPLRKGLREIARVHRGEFRLTPNQNLIVANIAPTERSRIEALIEAHALDRWRTASPLHLRALACVALPTCSQAFAEAERYLPDLVAKIEALLARHGLADASIGLRISGCPNGCSRPFLGEIGLVGKAPGRYNLMLGADASGQRLNVLHRENIDEAEILAVLDPLFAAYARGRAGDEGFGDFLVRNGTVAATPRKTIPLETLQ